MEAAPPEVGTAVAVVFDIGGQRPIWAGMPPERALAWTGVLIRRRPVWPGAGPMHLLCRAYEAGRPAGIAQWAHRARVAESIGIGPDRYEALHASLDRVPRTEAAAHPDNALDRSIHLHPVRAFDAVLWSPWSGLLDDGLEPDEATRLLLVARDAELRVRET